VHASPKLGIHKTVPTLILGHDYTGTTEICTLFLAPKYRGGGAGKLLSKGRFLFLANHPHRFADTVIAEMRGFSDENGVSPFWESLGRHFFDMDFEVADTLSGEESNEFIAELMPKYPIYVPLLTKEAQDVLGKVHPDTEPALELLKKEGFEYKNYVDIFDAGPTIETKQHNIDTIKRSQRLTADIIPSFESETQYLIANQNVEEFRCVLAPAKVNQNHLCIEQKIADLLQIQSGDTLTATPMV
jgi:arginine N-succinyltransferase